MNNPLKMIPTDAVAEKCGWRNRVSVYRHAKHDPTFPKPRQVSADRVAWIESEIDAWLADRPVAAAYIEAA